MPGPLPTLVPVSLYPVHILEWDHTAVTLWEYWMSFQWDLCSDPTWSLPGIFHNQKGPVLCCVHLTKRANDHSMCFCFCYHLPGMFKHHGHVFSFILNAVKLNTSKANHRTNKSYTKLCCCLSYALWSFPLDYCGVCRSQQWLGNTGWEQSLPRACKTPKAEDT